MRIVHTMATMNLAFVRVLFGDQRDKASRVHKILQDIKAAAQHQHWLPNTVTYVFGAENYEIVRKYGFAARLLDERPRVAGDVPGKPSKRCPWEHKPLGWAAALQEFDEIVALDWDIRPLEKIPLDSVFGELNKKSFLQANLLQYRRIKALYRRKMAGSIPDPAVRKIPSAAFVYLRGDDGRHAVQRTLSLMEQNYNLTEEQAMAIFVDELYGGWKGIDHWWTHHEPFCCRIPRHYEAVSRLGTVQRNKRYLFSY